MLYGEIDRPNPGTCAQVQGAVDPGRVKRRLVKFPAPDVEEKFVDDIQADSWGQLLQEDMTIWFLPLLFLLRNQGS